jgi:hypothetical protein
VKPGAGRAAMGAVGAALPHAAVGAALRRASLGAALRHAAVGTTGALAGLTGLAAVAAVVAGCHGSSPSGDSAPGAAGSAAAIAAPVAPVPVDHLAPGELLEGTEKAFDVLLPRGLRVEATFADVVMASGPLPMHPLVVYLRAHLQSGELREGDSSSTFDHVTVAGNERPLSVHILKAGEGVHVEIRDLTPVVLAPMPDEAARWKHVGLTPTGRLLDPTHLD